MPDTPARDRSVALAEIRDDEAKRLLGLVSAADLTARAAQWVADGVDNDAARALADGAGLAEEARVALLEQLAASQGVAFPNQRAARAHHGQAVIRSMTASSASADSLSFSNTFSDTIEESVRDSLSRLFPRRK